MIVASLVLIGAAVVLLALGLADGANVYLIASIATSMLAAMALIISGRQHVANQIANRRPRAEERLTGMDELLEPVVPMVRQSGAGRARGGRRGASPRSRETNPASGVKNPGGRDPGGRDPGGKDAGVPGVGAQSVGTRGTVEAEQPAPTQLSALDQHAAAAVALVEGASSSGESPRGSQRPQRQDAQRQDAQRQDAQRQPETQRQQRLEVPAPRPAERLDERPRGRAVERGPERRVDRLVETRDSGAVAADPLDEDDLSDEPGIQRTCPGDAARVALVSADVYVVDGRPRYHLMSCPHLLGKTSEPLPVREAVELGFTPCALCDPDTKLLGR